MVFYLKSSCVESRAKDNCRGSHYLGSFIHNYSKFLCNDSGGRSD